MSDEQILDIDIYLLFVNAGEAFFVLRELQNLKQKHMHYRYIKENAVLPGCIVVETAVVERSVTRVIGRHLCKIGYFSSFEIYKPLYT
jgi:Uri superfamily endonuclease